MTQPTLPGTSVDQDLSKWPRLAYCLDFIRRNREVTAAQIGAAWRIHGQGTWRFSSPKYDKENGNGIGESLRKRGLVKRVNIDGQRGYRAVVPGTNRAWREPESEHAECCDEYPFCGCAA